jgi:hypothetical protein
MIPPGRIPALLQSRIRGWGGGGTGGGEGGGGGTEAMRVAD